MAAGVRYLGAKIAQYAAETGQVVYSRIGTSNIVDNAYGVMNLAADGTTAVTGNPNSGPLASQGNLLKAEGNWWGLRFNSVTNPGPAISPTTNPQTPENPVNGTATLETVSGGTTSNSVDFFPYRSGPQSDPTNGQHPVLTAPIPVDDAAPSVSLSGPASANRGTRDHARGDGVRRLRRQARALCRGLHDARHRDAAAVLGQRDDPG